MPRKLTVVVSQSQSKNPAKRALEVAAAGSHNLLMMGPPGAGKSMLAQRLPGLLPPMTEAEAIESAAVDSVLGMGFEVYDGIGREIADPALDSLGELPDGGQFRGADALAQQLDKQTFVTCVSKKLFQYAIGRAPTVHDLDGAPEIATPAITLTLPDLITTIALSPAFSAPQPLETP